jgi:hypothetical protein
MGSPAIQTEKPADSRSCCTVSKTPLLREGKAAVDVAIASQGCNPEVPPLLLDQVARRLQRTLAFRHCSKTEIRCFTIELPSSLRLVSSICEPLTDPRHDALGDSECAIDTPAQLCLFLPLAEDENAWLLQKDAADTNRAEAPHCGNLSDR